MSHVATSEDAPTGQETELPLTGLRVLDLSSLYAGPWIATSLGDFGADVLKVEHPRGDDARRWGLSKDGIPLWWKVISRNKWLLALDLHVERDRDVVRQLAEQADVVIENFRPGRLEQWDLGYEDLSKVNPGLIMVRVTGFGQTGPKRQEPGFGTLAEAFSGFAYMTGQSDGPPTLPPFGLADGVAAISGTAACLMALYWRDVRGGTGQVVDLSLYEPLFSILGPQVSEYTQLGHIQKRQGNRSSRTSPRNAYATSDGRWVALSAGTQQIANRIFRAIDQPGLAENPMYATPQARRENADAVDAIVAKWIARHSLEDVLSAFNNEQAPIAPVYDTAQLVADPHYLARESIITLPDDDLGEVTMQNIVPRLSRTPGRIRHTGKTQIGADMNRIRDWIGDLAEIPISAPADDGREAIEE
jgi:crotonobetainyl-CoA:carnitine CoA-transferase CaiB-like acyl-CoA transferase